MNKIIDLSKPQKSFFNLVKSLSKYPIIPIDDLKIFPWSHVEIPKKFLFKKLVGIIRGKYRFDVKEMN